jgi:hypothetical protein
MAFDDLGNNILKYERTWLDRSSDRDTYLPFEE